MLADFVKQGFIRETVVDGRKKSYIITPSGQQMVENEYARLKTLVDDYEKNMD